MAILPEHPSLEHLKGQAKRLHRSAQATDQAALARVGPYFGDPSRVKLQQAQLVIAREYGFSSWTRLKRHVEAGLGAQDTPEIWSNRFLDLACLHYGPDRTRGVAEFEQAAAILAAHPDIVSHSIHAAAAAGDTSAVQAWLASAPADVDLPGGPFQWSPLMYAAYARLPGRSTYPVGQLLLQAGADPNFSYLWGGEHRFAVLTGIFGGGEGGPVRLPEHPDMVPFARAVLDAGANPNETQGAYNRCFQADDTHLQLMLDYGLKPSDLVKWWDVAEGEGEQAPRTMHWNFMMALRFGFADRSRLLIEHGVDLDRPDDSAPTLTSRRTPYQVALLRGLPEIADVIKAKGGDATPLGGQDAFYAAVMAGDTQTAKRLRDSTDGETSEIEAELFREAASNGQMVAVETMIALGFDLNPQGAKGPLHLAALHGHTEVIKRLLAAGADPKLRDPIHHGPPIGHAFHGQHEAAIALLMEAEMDIFCAAALGVLPQVKARLAEDASWLEARLDRVLPTSASPFELSWVTPIWMAAIRGQWVMVEALAGLGADTKMLNPDGQSLREVAAEAGQDAPLARLSAG